jgi:hypothetical protein
MPIHLVNSGIIFARRYNIPAALAGGRNCEATCRVLGQLNHDISHDIQVDMYAPYGTGTYLLVLLPIQKATSPPRHMKIAGTFTAKVPITKEQKSCCRDCTLDFKIRIKINISKPYLLIARVKEKNSAPSLSTSD